LERIIGTVTGKNKGPLIIICCALHGNENAGLKALESIFNKLYSINPNLISGKLIGIIGNMEALKTGERYIDKDLNRMWRDHDVQTILNCPVPLELVEEVQLKEIHNLIKLEQVKYPSSKNIFMDLHTTSANHGVFGIIPDVMVGDKIANQLSVPIIVGLAENLKGTALSYWTKQGMKGFAFEVGDHYAKESVITMEAGICMTLLSTGFISEDDFPTLVQYDQTLNKIKRDIPQYVKLVYHHFIKPIDKFVMLPNFQNFQMVKKGELLANDKNGPIFAAEDSFILMPLYQDQGQDGFFLVKPFKDERIDTKQTTRYQGTSIN
jgi:succinylglutamate desuccinylase